MEILDQLSGNVFVSLMTFVCKRPGKMMKGVVFVVVVVVVVVVVAALISNCAVCSRIRLFGGGHAAIHRRTVALLRRQ